MENSWIIFCSMGTCVEPPTRRHFSEKPMEILRQSIFRSWNRALDNEREKISIVACVVEEKASVWVALMNPSQVLLDAQVHNVLRRRLPLRDAVLDRAGDQSGPVRARLRFARFLATAKCRHHPWRSWFRVREMGWRLALSFRSSQRKQRSPPTRPNSIGFIHVCCHGLATVVTVWLRGLSFLKKRKGETQEKHSFLFSKRGDSKNWNNSKTNVFLQEKCKRRK